MKVLLLLLGVVALVAFVCAEDEAAAAKADASVSKVRLDHLRFDNS